MCLSVCASPLQSHITFDNVRMMAAKFWAGDSDPSALGVGPDPNLSPLGVLGQRGRVVPFQNQDNEANRTLGAEF